MLKKTMRGDDAASCGGSDDGGGIGEDAASETSLESSKKPQLGGNSNPAAPELATAASPLTLSPPCGTEFVGEAASSSEMRATFNSIEYQEAEVPYIIPKGSEMLTRKTLALAPALGAGGHSQGPPLALRRRGSNSENTEDEDDEEETETDEFFDCREDFDDASSLAKWSSMDLVPLSDEEAAETISSGLMTCNRRRVTCSSGSAAGGSEDQALLMRRVQSLSEKPSAPKSKGTLEPLLNPAAPHLLFSRPSMDAQASLDEATSSLSSAPTSANAGEVCCATTVLILVVHGGSVLDPHLEPSVRKSDVLTFRGAFESIMRNHYPSLVGHVVIKCVPCPGICTDALALLSNLNPYRLGPSFSFHLSQ